MTPQIRINSTTNEWEISTDNGTTWNTTGVKATATVTSSASECLFKNIDVKESEVTFTLSDNTTFSLGRHSVVYPTFVIDSTTATFTAGESKTFTVTAANIESYSISKPDGWRVSYTDGQLTVTAPVESNVYAEQSGEVSVFVVSKSGNSVIAKLAVSL